MHRHLERAAAAAELRFENNCNTYRSAEEHQEKRCSKEKEEEVCLCMIARIRMCVAPKSDTNIPGRVAGRRTRSECMHEVKQISMTFGGFKNVSVKTALVLRTLLVFVSVNVHITYLPLQISSDDESSTQDQIDFKDIKIGLSGFFE